MQAAVRKQTAGTTTANTDDTAYVPGSPLGTSDTSP